MQHQRTAGQERPLALQYFTSTGTISGIISLSPSFSERKKSDISLSEELRVESLSILMMQIVGHLDSGEVEEQPLRPISHSPLHFCITSDTSLLP